MLGIADARARLLAGSTAIVAAEERLTDADRAIGDGDHGVGMARGFRAAAAALEEKPAETVGDLFRHVGMAVMSTSGGASGAIFGTLFVAASKPLGAAEVGGAALAEALAAALEAVKARGKAAEGDKTLIDALAPAAAAARAAGEDPATVLAAAAQGAAGGAEATRTMRAATGKARSLGDRSVGHVDPGALSLSIFLSALAAPTASGRARAS